MKMESLARLAPQENKPPAFQLKKLAPKHKQIASLLAQGTPRPIIADLMKVTPEYVTMLSKDVLMVDYMKEMSLFANRQLEAMFEKSVETISDVMNTGSAKERLGAARLQMEATRRVGRTEMKVTHEHSLVSILSGMPSAGPIVPIRDTTSVDEKVVSEQ